MPCASLKSGLGILSRSEYTRVQMDTHALFSVAIAIVLGVGAAKSLRGLLQHFKNTAEGEFPLTRNSMVHAATPGKKVISIEAHRGANCSRIVFSVRDSLGHSTPVTRVLVPMTVSGLTTVRQSVAHFELDAPGDYELLATGVTPDERSFRVHIHASHPLALVAWIIALVLSAVGMIGAVIVGFIVAQTTGP